MTEVVKREPALGEPVDLFERFDRMFDEWMRGFPFHWPTLARWDSTPGTTIRVDEYKENGTLVVKAELPGIDPHKDVELTVSDGRLHLHAERRAEETVEEKGYIRHELRDGTFTRSLPLPAGVSESDINATYKHGILEIRIPAPEAEAAKQIPIAKG